MNIEQYQEEIKQIARNISEDIDCRIDKLNSILNEVTSKIDSCNHYIQNLLEKEEIINKEIEDLYEIKLVTLSSRN